MIQTYSPNMLKTFDQCPKKFYFKYIKNISMPVNDDIFELGKNIHALASYYLKKENIYKMEQTLSEREKNIWGYLKNVKYFSYEVINTEYNLSFNLDGNFFGGRLDALVKKDDTYYIIDYKTGAIPKSAKYDFQTIIYLLAVSIYFNTEKVVFVYLDLKNKDEFEIKLTNELISEYKSKLSEIINKIRLNDFQTKFNNCKCEYNLICY